MEQGGGPADVDASTGADAVRAQPVALQLEFVRLLPAALLEPLFEVAAVLLQTTPKADLPGSVHTYAGWSQSALRKTATRQALRRAFVADADWRRLVWAALREAAVDAPPGVPWRVASALLAGDLATVASEWVESERSAALAQRMDAADDAEREAQRLRGALQSAVRDLDNARAELVNARATAKRGGRVGDAPGHQAALAERDALAARAAQAEAAAASHQDRVRDAEAERHRLREAITKERANVVALQAALAATNLQAGGTAGLRRAAAVLRDVADVLDREAGTAVAPRPEPAAGASRRARAAPANRARARAGPPGAGLLPAGATTAEPAALRAVLARDGVRCIVDGYNVLLARDGSGTLAARRDRLLHRLAGLHLGTGALIQVVFDGARVDDGPGADRAGPGVRVEFTPPDAIADDRIAEIAAEAGARAASACVVTSDAELRARCERHGILVFPSETLLRALA